jgi:CHAD domain-containing protein
MRLDMSAKEIIQGGGKQAGDKRPAAAEVGDATPLWLAARLTLAAKGEELFKLRRKVLRDFDPEDIHDLRVCSRRLREALQLFAPCFPAEAARKLSKKLRRLTRLLGELRNHDEALAFFRALAGEFAGDCAAELQAFCETLSARRQEAVDELTAGLGRALPPSLRRRFRELINEPLLFEPPEGGIDLLAPIRDFAGSAVASRYFAVEELIAPAREPEDFDAQHRLRIAVKLLRYRVELLAFHFGEGFGDLHARLKEYQEVLGQMHDLRVFLDLAANEFTPECRPLLSAAIDEKWRRLYQRFSHLLTTESIHIAHA